MAAPLPLEEAQARLLALAPRLPVEHVAVEEALGRYLAEPLVARRTQPAADLSAMDGYAVCANDLAGPWRVVGESAAGHPYARALAPGEAARVSTGALVPPGAVAVIVQEDCARAGDLVTLAGDGPSPPHRHIRRRAMDFTEGKGLLSSGTRIGPAQIALALAAGHSHLPVRRMPRVVIIDSGDELACPGEDCPPHRIPASNGAMLGALVAALPVAVTRIWPVADELPRLIAALSAAGDGDAGADIIVTSGGASVGDHDLIRPALEAWGATIDFWKVAIKPGKPLLIARRGEQLIVGLPGNPVSSLVTALLFLMPVLRAALGAAHALPTRFDAPLATALPATGARREFRRAFWDGTCVHDGEVHDSGALASLAAANCLIDRAADAAEAKAGETAEIVLIDPPGMA